MCRKNHHILKLKFSRQKNGCGQNEMFDGLSTKIVASTDFSLQKHRNIALAYHNGTTVRFSYFGLKKSHIQKWAWPKWVCNCLGPKLLAASSFPPRKTWE